MSKPQREARAVTAVPLAQGRASAEPALARTMLLPLSFAVVFGVRYGLGTTMTIAVACMAPLIVLFAVSPVLAARSGRRFERVVATALATGNPKLLARAWGRARLFRWFGIPAHTSEKRGLVASAQGDMRAARDAYGEARAAYGGQAPLGVELGYGEACYALEDDEEAIESLRRVVTIDATLFVAHRHLAHALLRSGRDEGESAGLLEKCPEPADDLEAHYFRLLYAAASDDPNEAKSWRKKAGKPKDEVARELAALARAGASDRRHHRA